MVDSIPCAEDPTELLLRFATEHGLVVREMGSVARDPDSRHWHLQKPGVTGVLEVTWLPRGAQLQFKVARNRAAPWIPAVAAALAPALSSPNG